MKAKRQDAKLFTGNFKHYGRAQGRGATTPELKKKNG
jgi:hypothetical protein